MTKMNYRLDHSRDLTVRPATYEEQQRAKRLAATRKRGFPAKYDGKCANCKASFPVLTLITIRKDGRPVHSGGCFRK
jgi:hypothetical protein